VGIALAHRSGDTSESLLSRADEAMYEEKRRRS
jgi:predicted signal transduction protein with EAL and GGDEF domain